jgi:phosphomannomutase
MEIFKEYDIRGVYGEDITEEFAYKLGRSIVMFFRCSDLIVARDGRNSSDVLFENLCKGVMDQGCSIYDVGLASTPHFYFTINRFKKPGVIITASHNPKEYNGFKIMDKDLNSISLKSGLKDIKKLTENPNFQEPYKKGNYIQINTKRYYLDFLEEHSVDKNISFVVDMSSGSGKLESDFLDGKYTNCIVINSEIDGNFPSHSPDPTNSDSQTQIKQKILANKADFGVMFDGDADRALFFDEKANPIRPELLVSILDLKSPVLYDVRSSLSLSVVCDEKKIKSFMIKAGRSNFVEEMKKRDAFIGVEGSGHYFFKEFYYVDSAILAVLKLIENLKIPLSEQIEKNTYYFHSGEINFKVKNRKAVLEKIKRSFKPTQQSELDGLSMYFEDIWFNIRSSNTEPVIRLNVEAKSKQKLTETINALTIIIKNE